MSYEGLLAAAGLPTDRRGRRADRGPGADDAHDRADGSTRRWWVLLAAAVLVEQGLFIASWWVLGTAVLDDAGLTASAASAWIGLLAGTIAARTVAVWASGRAGTGIGARIRRRLIATILRLDPDTIADRGVGGLLGIVTEANVLETATVNGALAAATGTAFAAGGIAVIAAADTGVLWPAVVAWAVSTLTCAAVYWPRRRRWQHERRAHTDTLVERLLGHRTVQLHDDHTARTATDRAALDAYDTTSRRADRLAAALTAGIGRTWLAVAVTLLAATIDGQATAATLAAFGGIVLVAQASELIGRGVIDLADARLADHAVHELTDLPPHPTPATCTDPDGHPVAAHRLTHTYRPDRPPVLDQVDLTIAAGDRVVLTGASGSGKTTLAELLTGLRAPTAGSITTSGTTALVPQYDDNHIFLGTLAYNLLLGVVWPPEPDHLDAAEHLCRELGLQPLLDRMPSGIFENVGETGWQLSHGEQARIHLARALLAQPDLVVIDETFGTLDPHSHHHALATVLRHSGATLLVAHP